MDKRAEGALVTLLPLGPAEAALARRQFHRSMGHAVRVSQIAAAFRRDSVTEPRHAALPADNAFERSRSCTSVDRLVRPALLGTRLERAASFGRYRRTRLPWGILLTSPG